MLRRYSLKESRNSADYRYVKNNAKTHPIENTVWMNPIRNGASIRSMKWKKIDLTNYDDEDLVVYEGVSDKETIKLFIGFDTNKIYRVERSWKPTVGKSILMSCFFLGNFTKTPPFLFLIFLSIFCVPSLPSTAITLLFRPTAA